MTRRPKRAARKAARRFIDDEAGDDSIRGSQRSGSVGSYQQDSFVAPDGEVEEVADTDFDGIIPDEDVFPPSLADSDSDSEIDDYTYWRPRYAINYRKKSRSVSK